MHNKLKIQKKLKRLKKEWKENDKLYREYGNMFLPLNRDILQKISILEWVLNINQPENNI